MCEQKHAVRTREETADTHEPSEATVEITVNKSTSDSFKIKQGTWGHRHDNTSLTIHSPKTHDRQEREYKTKET